MPSAFSSVRPGTRCGDAAMTRGRPARFETTLHLHGRDLVARYDGSTWELTDDEWGVRESRSLLELLEQACGEDPETLRAAITTVLAAMDSDLPSMHDPSWVWPT
jgi:hypothetical protein